VQLWFLVAALWALPASASAGGITNSGGDLRDGWYGNQAGLTPSLVGGGTFGQLWSTTVDGQVYAQPLVNGDQVIVATERNQVSSLDAESGTPAWQVTLPHGTAWNPADVACGDLTPDVGVTSTPVIDDASGTVYLTHKTYVSGTSGDAAWYMDALDLATGQERPGFPVKLEGPAQNTSSTRYFNAKYELQRPGLLLLDGVVYAAFGGHCDVPPYQGWVFGVSTAGQVKARWNALQTGHGAGIWQSGAGLMSDGTGSIFLSTGNGGTPTPGTAGTSTTEGQFGEAVVHLQVQGDGTLKATDFFAPYDAARLDDWDGDFASGGVTALRDDVFGNLAYPHVAVAVGKAGYIYILNRSDLGGIGTGTSGSDRVLQRLGPYGGVWSRPAVWPGDGGWVLIPTAAGEPDVSGRSGYLKWYKFGRGLGGLPALSLSTKTPDTFGFGSSAPVITSNGTTSGTALAWLVWSPDASGVGAQLRAYDATPQNGAPKLRYSTAIGTATKFTPPGVGGNRIFVGTRDGHVLGFGSPVSPALSGTGLVFGSTTVGDPPARDVLHLTADRTLTISSVSASPAGTFTADTSALSLPAALDAGDHLDIPVAFSPPSPGTKGGAVTIATSRGTQTFSLSGNGNASGPLLTALPPVVSFGGTTIGSKLASSGGLANEGNQDLTVTAVEEPGPPFTVTGLPQAGDAIPAGSTLHVSVEFDPELAGDYADALVVHSTGGDQTIGLTGAAAAAGVLSFTPGPALDFGSVPLGGSVTNTLTLTNTGASALTIMKSKAPSGGSFTALDPLDEGTTLPPGGTRALRIRFAPAVAGREAGTWAITASDGQGARQIALTGLGATPAIVGPPAPPAPPVITDPAPPFAGLPPSAPVRRAAGLSLSAERHGARIRVAVRGSSLAVGKVDILLRATVRGKTVTQKVTAQLRAGRLRRDVTLPRKARAWSRLKIAASFAGSALVKPGTARAVTLRR
jgi:iron transport multicopper oxidase